MWISTTFVSVIISLINYNFNSHLSDIWVKQCNGSSRKEALFTAKRYEWWMIQPDGNDKYTEIKKSHCQSI